MASSTSPQQFNLRWNNHTNNIIEVFAEQLTSESLVDVTISCEGQFIKAHKMVLSACSPYFQLTAACWSFGDVVIFGGHRTVHTGYQLSQSITKPRGLVNLSGCSNMDVVRFG
ncbi:hypothetical protein J6590_011029 [Homalodisca vitripennis]|nr:hypothetical protein J6590_011029 [Homalodisca vitripennis]